MFIDLYRSDLVAGYDRIRETQAVLPSLYRQDLLRVYGHRLQAYQRGLRRARTWKARTKPGLLLLSLLLVTLCGAGFWLSMRGSSTGLVLFCLAGMLVLVFVVFGLMLGSEPHPPENPLGKDAQGRPSQLRRQLFPDLTRQWLGGLAARVPNEAQVQAWADQSGKHGLIGEFDFVRALAAALPPNVFILHGLMQNYGDDLDVVVVGPFGVWLFEVKYLHANIVYQQGTWEFWHYNHTTSQSENLDHGEPPDQQWLRMRDEIRRTLAYRGRDLVKQLPALGDIRGGIVFSHPQASYDIEKSPPFAWGRIPGWVSTLKSAHPLPGMTLRVQLQLLDLLLARHHSVKPGGRVVSMEGVSERLIGEAKGRIKAWVGGG